MLRLFAILLVMLATGCGPSFYDRCVLGMWETYPHSLHEETAPFHVGWLLLNPEGGATRPAEPRQEQVHL